MQRHACPAIYGRHSVLLLERTCQSRQNVTVRPVLICKAGLQSTIDMLNFWRDNKVAKGKGSPMVHPYNLGVKRNFQVHR